MDQLGFWACLASFDIRLKRTVGLVALSALILTHGGCGNAGPDRHPVTGTVTVDGKPLQLGTIFFIPDDGGRTAIGTIKADGTYQLSTSGNNDGAGPGNYTVTIDAVEIEVQGEEQVQARSLQEELSGVGAVENAPRSKATSYISRVYADKSTSPLKATVVAGQLNELNFEVTK